MNNTGMLLSKEGKSIPENYWDFMYWHLNLTLLVYLSENNLNKWYFNSYHADKIKQQSNKNTEGG